MLQQVVRQDIQYYILKFIPKIKPTHQHGGGQLIIFRAASILGKGNLNGPHQEYYGEVMTLVTEDVPH